jgi:hypothetical protein
MGAVSKYRMNLQRKGKRRKFGRYIFRFASWWSNKKEAESSKRHWEKRDHQVRVVPDSGGYSVYIRG